MTGQSKEIEIESLRKESIGKITEKWRLRPPHIPLRMSDSIWEELWKQYDFSWNGLADAGWDSAKGQNRAQKEKQWLAPPNFPLDVEIHGEGKNAYKKATLQDYWRWSIGIYEDEENTYLLSDKELIDLGHLISDSNGKLWHIAHIADIKIVNTGDGRYEVKELHDTMEFDKILIPLLHEKSSYHRNFFHEKSKIIPLRGSRASSLCKFINQLYSSDSQEKINIDISFSKLTDTINIINKNNIGSFTADFSNFSSMLFFSKNVVHNDFRILNSHFSGFVSLSESFFHSNFFIKWTRFNLGFTSVKSEFKSKSYFSGSIFCKNIDIINCTFQDTVGFQRSIFGPRTTIKLNNFRKDANFSDTIFENGVDFSKNNYSGPATFKNSQFLNKYWIEKINFQHCTFTKQTIFTNIKLPSSPLSIQSSFEGSQFLQDTFFSTPNFNIFSSFNGAVFRGKVLLAPSLSDEEEQSRFKNILRETKAATEADDTVKAASDYNPEKDNDRDLRGTNARFSALEGGLRTLKLAMANEKDHAQELRFFRFELQARRHRPSTSFLEKAASRAYGLLSDYGNSIGRPLSALVLSVLGFWVIYWIWGASLDQSFHGLEKERSALEFSIRNVVQPFGPWTATAKSTLFELEMVKIVTCGGPPAEICAPTGPGWLLFRLLATLQSVFSLLLAFLFALALRKKFQIN